MSHYFTEWHGPSEDKNDDKGHDLRRSRTGIDQFPRYHIKIFLHLLSMFRACFDY
jgi:hypothetical protein